jgi:hypothetical protein
MAMFGTSDFASRRFLFAPAQHPAIGGTVTPDLSLGSIWQVFFPAGNITLATPINANVGDFLTLSFIQDSVGARTITWDPTNHNYFRPSTFALTLTANGVDSITFAFAPQLSWGCVGFSNNLVNT